MKINRSGSKVFLSKWIVLVLLHLLMKALHVHLHFFSHIHVSFIFHFLSVVLLVLFSFFHFILPLLIEDILLIKSINLRLNSHFGIFLLLSFCLHLNHSCSFHLNVSILHRLLSHPHFVILYVALVTYLLSGFLLYTFLSFHISQLCDIVSLIQFLFDEPLLHIVHS